jgi:hypothetical protein
MTKAGFNSVADPRYVITAQRESIDNGRRTGASRGQPVARP